MDLAKALEQMYPTLSFARGDALLIDDGTGARIGVWKYPAAQPTVDDIQAAWLAYQAGNLGRAIEVAKLQLTATVNAYSVQVFSPNDPGKLEIYREKQSLVHAQIPALSTPDWEAVTPPGLAVAEWERREAAGLTAVAAIGLNFTCVTALDLFKTWWLNTYFADWLRAQSEGLRVVAQAAIEGAADEATISAVMAQFASDLAALPAEFAAEVAPGLIVASGLTMLQ